MLFCQTLFIPRDGFSDNTDIFSDIASWPFKKENADIFSDILLEFAKKYLILLFVLLKICTLKKRLHFLKVTQIVSKAILLNR